MYSVTIHDETEHTVPLVPVQFVQGDNLNTRNLYKEEVDKLIVGDKAISDITEDGLEVTLVRRLLDK
jgi:hypothetical protein